MFGGPHEQLSEKEIREGEAQATAQVQFFTVACLALWFCTLPPLPVEVFLETLVLPRSAGRLSGSGI
ncbi:hypothetical protein Z517_06408 [Fonsecaea pedrosoi CBS 271.37]|uniref:Uncharacterized protein n=1 Tax=Fonsecaea pedrosoi CBS 271.37 TaxID=1442368 RepID=A0A0D2GG54_9EURO|nr:uncharacterized protein Z517_06408 [Fonsecaea pedrosoi CBS 271.37]KIW79793.1 hypothetical protein Z517_06408 [Fonsecaea pedrosoi CBS 271.37]